MKKIFLAIFFLALCILSARPALAQSNYILEVNKQTQAFGGTQGANLGEPRDPRLVVAYVIQALLGLLGVLFLGYTLYAGFLILTSRGEEDKITKGKETLKTAVIGVLIVMSAYSITLIGARIASGGRSQYDEAFRDDVGDAGTRDPGAALREGGEFFGGRGELQVNEDPGEFIREDPLD